MSLAVQLSTGEIASIDVRKVLTTCGLRSWGEDSIVAYMAAERAKYRPNIWYHVGRPMLKLMIALIWICGLAAAWGCVSCIWAAGYAGVTFLFTGHTWVPSASALVPMLGLWILGGAVAIGFSILHSKIYYNEIRLKVRGPAEWLIYPADTFKGQVPAMAQSIMSKVKRLFPGAGFTIHNLHQSERDLDPVLFVEVGTESIALLVWGADGTIVLPR